jgi:hypothetical protein
LLVLALGLGAVDSSMAAVPLEHAAPLRGSHESLVHQNEMAEADGLERILDDADLKTASRTDRWCPYRFPLRCASIPICPRIAATAVPGRRSS